MASHYECEHVKQAKATAKTIKLSVQRECQGGQLLEVVTSLPGDTPPMVQVSEQSFAVFGLPTASNPLGFCHLKKGGQNRPKLGMYALQKTAGNSHPRVQLSKQCAFIYIFSSPRWNSFNQGLPHPPLHPLLQNPPLSYLLSYLHRI